MRRDLVRATLGAAVLLVFGSPAAMAQVSTAEAEAFVGEWAATVQSDQGAIELTINIMDDGGDVSGEVSNPDGSMAAVEDVSMSGSDLVLGYTVDMGGGQMFPVEVSLAAGGDGLDVTLSAGDGQFMATGTATEQ